MKKLSYLVTAAALLLSLTACSSSGSAGKSAASASASASASEQTSAAEETEKPKEAAEWEVGETTANVWTDSIGSKWVQMICPVTNTGTKNLYLSAATMDLEDTDGNLVDSKQMVNVFPEVIQPGETAYYYDATTLDSGAPDELVVVPHVNVKEATVDCIRFPVTDVAVTDEEYLGIKMTGRVENDSDKEASLIYVTAFLFDENDNMIASLFTILTDPLAAGDKIGFSATALSLPDSVTADMVDHYEVYAYPQQFQF